MYDLLLWTIGGVCIYAIVFKNQQASIVKT